MQPITHASHDGWSTRGFSTVDPERQGVRTGAAQHAGERSAVREAEATPPPAAAGPLREPPALPPGQRPGAHAH